MTKRWKQITAAGLLAGMMTASGGISLADTSRVRIRDFRFRPRVTEINKGDRVRWVNKDGATHTATANNGNWTSGRLQTGEAYARRFRFRGTYRYHCKLHPDMTGKVVVS